MIEWQTWMALAGVAAVGSGVAYMPLAATGITLDLDMSGFARERTGKGLNPLTAQCVDIPGVCANTGLEIFTRCPDAPG